MKAGSGDWRLGWQSNSAAHLPEMAVLCCPLPSGAARLHIQHAPAPSAGTTLAVAPAGARQMLAALYLWAAAGIGRTHLIFLA